MLLACALVSGGFTLAAKAAQEPAPPPSQRTVQIVLDVPPEPVIAPPPPMDVLPAGASREFDLTAYRQEIVDLRARAAAEAALYAQPAAADWSAPLDQAPLENYAPPF